MIPSNPLSTTASSQPVSTPSVPQSTFLTSASGLKLPPVKGNLPYAKQDYEQLPEEEKTPELSIREQERQAREASAQPLSTTTMTTDATATITTTTSTMTTTTTTPPSGSSS